MDVHTDGRPASWTDGRTGNRTDGRATGRTDTGTDQRTDGPTEACKRTIVDARFSARMQPRMYPHLHGTSVCNVQSATTLVGSAIALMSQAASVAQGQFSCSSSWSLHNAEVLCGAVGGRSGAVHVKDAGGWTHAFYEVLIQTGSVYQMSAELYAEALSECDSGAAVTWCSPSIVVCPGKYQPTFYETGGCYVGLAPTGKDKWERFVAEFVAEADSVTVYINQESTKYDSWLSDINIVLLQGSGGMAKTVYAQPAELTIGCLPYNDREVAYYEDSIARINANDEVLPNTTLRVKCTVGKPLQTAIDHFREDKAIASVVSAYSSATKEYSNVAFEQQRVMLGVRDSTPNYKTEANHFTLASDTSSGTAALLSDHGLFQFFGWTALQLYFQSDQQVVADHIASEASKRGYTYRSLQAGSNIDEDLAQLLVSDLNIMIFIGGYGCFGELTKRIVKEKPTVVVICCCLPYLLASTDFPPGTLLMPQLYRP